MEEPDYDDMIEDYMEDYEEPPPAVAGVSEYDEDFLAEMEANTAADHNDNTTTAQSQDINIDDDEPPQSPIARNLGGRLAALSSSATRTEATSPPAAQVRRDLVTSRSREGSTPPDIYSFERYNRNASWRQDAQTSPSTMRAREWKTKTSRMNSGNHNKKEKQQLASTPEAQLLQYMNHGCQYHSSVYSKKLQIARNDPNMSLLPPTPFQGGKTSITMTLGDGNRVFVREHQLELQKTTTTTQAGSNNTFSLGISMTDLIRRVQAMRRKKEHDQLKSLSKQLQQQRKTLSSNNTGEDEDEVMEETEDTAEEPTTVTISRTPGDDQLWVDKHAPSTFANLLSDERTNREVLRALREWDPYVFKKDPPPRPKFGNFQSDDEPFNPNPHDKRPLVKNRVILLSGAPGVGKTTLAHILARHCGYRPLEVNGSDERSATALTDRVVRAMESATLDMGQTADWKGRPNCIILDEIDGADASRALKALVELIRQDMPNNNKKDEDGNKTKRRNNNKPYLKRPIIFICNNLYAPALRPLLPFARLFQVEPPTGPRLVARLRAVLSAEGLSLWGGTRLLHELVSASGGDIRSCLFTLQFAAAQVHQQQKQQQGNKKGLEDISRALESALKGDGLKDDRTDVAGTTMTVFRKIKKKGKSDRLWGTQQQLDPRTSVERVFDAVESFGEHNKMLDCIYLNLMKVSYIDPTFDRCAAALHWLSGADNRSVQNVFAPCVAAAIHLLCRVEQKPDLTYTTRELSDNHYQLEANLALTHKFAEGLSVKYRGSRAPDAMVKDTIPYALWMLSAGEGSSALSRPVTSVEILNKLEKASFHSHAETLRTLGLSYVASMEDQAGFYERNDAPQALMILEPPIDHLVQFQEFNHTHSSIRKEIPPAMKELLAHQASLQGIRENKAKEPQKMLGGNTTEMVTKKQPEKPMQSTTKEKQQEKAEGPLQSTTKENRLEPQATTKPSSTESPQKPLVTPPKSTTTAGKKTRSEVTKKVAGEEERPAKRQKSTPISASNFLTVGAKRAKAAKSRAMNVGFVRKTDKKSNTGSGVPFRQVLRLKYVKGFTQAVRNPCRLDDLA